MCSSIETFCMGACRSPPPTRIFPAMKRFPLPLMFVLACALAWTAPLLAAEAESADALWAKVEDALKKMDPAEPPKTMEEAVAHFKKAIVEVDDSAKAFEKKFPQDPRRWKIRLFEGMTAETREQMGATVKTDLMTALEGVLNSSDADTGTKAEASAIKVLVATEGIATLKLTREDWIKLAEAHLKAYPAQKFNAAIEAKISGFKMLKELQGKPLDLKFKAIDDREVDLEKLRGKVVLIDFWATWCPPCVANVPDLVKLYDKLHARGFEIIGISLDQDKAATEAFLKEAKVSWPQYFDGKGWSNEISSRYAIGALPAMWLVNKKGMVVDMEAYAQLEATVEKLLAE